MSIPSQSEKKKINQHKYEQEYAAMGKLSGVEKEEEIEHPFDADKIAVSMNRVPLNRLIYRIEKGSISTPEIQRNDNLWDKKQKSRLIESLMLRIPIPLFYVAADLDENWKIVDGLQRVSAIRQFMIDKSLTLQNLEFLDSYNGYGFDKLPDKYQNRILDTEFNFAVISATTPNEVQRNIFKRLNTGGLPLTQQEVRHALYHSQPTSKFLLELVNSRDFVSATTGSVDDSRMAGRELILRFISFLIRDPKVYPKTNNMDEHLSDTMLLMNAMPEMDRRTLEKSFYKRQIDTYCRISDFTRIRDHFSIGMNRAKDLFGRHAFRKSTILSDNRAPINKSIFECVAVVLSQLDKERFEYLLAYKDELIRYIHSSYLADTDLYYAVSRDSQKYTSVQTRFSWFRETLVYRDYGGSNA